MKEVKKEIANDIAIGYTLATGRLFVEYDKFLEFAEKLLGEVISHKAFSNNLSSEHLWKKLRAKYEEERLKTFK